MIQITRRLILDYEMYFGVKPPENRISIIKHICKENILYEITGLNYRLKPKNRILVDDTFETQARELRYFTRTKELLIKYSSIANKHTKNKIDFPNIFNKPACLFAIEEIVNSDEIHPIEGFSMEETEVWESILKYLLAVNYTITQIKKEQDSSKISFESLNPKLIPLNEIIVETDPFYTAYRGYCLINYFLNNTIFSTEVREYFYETYGVEPNYFVFQVISMYNANRSANPNWDFCYFVKDGDQNLFDKLSVRNYNKETYKLLNIRKSPFIKIRKLRYLIADNSFLVEKTYSQFLNDFWFDRVKHIKDDIGNNKFSIKLYRSEFGYFFEKYLCEILKRCFENHPHSTLLMFDQLKVKAPTGQIEIADVYFRSDNKIFLGQVKSGSIYDMEKYGGDINSLYKNDRNAFFENFGVNQIVESLTNVSHYACDVDPKFLNASPYEIYPCIIVNDKPFQTPLMANTFNTRFQELIKDFSTKKFIVKPLALIHINDLERLEDDISKNPENIWHLLQCNHMNRKFIPPFYSAINDKGLGVNYSKTVLDTCKMLITKYSHSE